MHTTQKEMKRKYRNEIFSCNQKGHLKTGRLAKFGCEML